MSDLMIDERIRTAFAELRADEQPRVYPPGPDAARRTVRRRRRVATVSATACLTALVAVGAGNLAGAGGEERGGQRGGTAPASVASDAVTAPATALQRQRKLTQLTLNALGHPPAGARFMAIGWGPVRSGDPYTSRYTLPADLSGSYLLRVSCGDPDGAVTVDVQAGGEAATATARCGTTADEVTAGIGEATLVVAGPDAEMRMTVEPDEAAMSDGSRPVVGITLIRR